MSFLVRLGRRPADLSAFTVYDVILMIIFVCLTFTMFSSLTAIRSQLPLIVILTIVQSRHYLSLLWHSWNTWRPLQLVLPLTVYSACFYCLWRFIPEVFADELVGWALCVVCPMLFQVVFELAYQEDNSPFIVPLYSLTLRVIMRLLDSVWSLCLIPTIVYIDTRPSVFAPAHSVLHNEPFYITLILRFCVFWFALLAAETGELSKAADVRFSMNVLGEWLELHKATRSTSPGTSNPSEWDSRNAPYPDNAVVKCKGILYRAKGLTAATPGNAWRYLGMILKFAFSQNGVVSIKLLLVISALSLGVLSSLTSDDHNSTAFTLIILACLQGVYLLSKRTA